MANQEKWKIEKLEKIKLLGFAFTGKRQWDWKSVESIVLCVFLCNTLMSLNSYLSLLLLLERRLLCFSLDRDRDLLRLGLLDLDRVLVSFSESASTSVLTSPSVASVAATVASTPLLSPATLPVSPFSLLVSSFSSFSSRSLLFRSRLLLLSLSLDLDRLLRSLDRDRDRLRRCRSRERDRDRLLRWRSLERDRRRERDLVLKKNKVTRPFVRN